MCSPGPHTQTYTVTLALKIWWYDCMKVCIYCSLRVTNCLCLCQFRMHCCLGLWRRWCFQSGPLWPWLCKRVCNVIMSRGEELLWQGTINSLIDACHANTTHLTHHITSYATRTRTVRWGQVWVYAKERGHQHVNMRDPTTFRHTLLVYLHYITPPCGEWQALSWVRPSPHAVCF